MSNITKQDILKAIQQAAKENGGVPLGRGRFEKETGIKPYDWGKYWAKLGDAQREAGFDPNTLNAAYDTEFILEKYVALIKELGHFPTSGDLLVKSNSDSAFPSANTMRKIGNKQEIAQKILEFATRKGYSDMVALCEEVIKTRKEDSMAENLDVRLNIGAVYLFKHGKYYKIGKTNDTVRRGNELKIQLPENLDLIHEIKTDDPNGIEAYWHRRFDSKRMNGEWFDLNSSDIKAFKRWRKII